MALVIAALHGRVVSEETREKIDVRECIFLLLHVQI